MKHLCITVRWLDGRYDGLLERNGPPEWPPSPFRLLQALVAGVARRGHVDGEIGESLKLLEGKPPIIIAPRSLRGQAITRYVPNNDSDKVPDRQGRLTAKTSWPTIMLDPPTVHYLWRIDEDCSQLTGLIEASRCLSSLGWGIDTAYADGQLLDEEQIGDLKGVRWFPKPGTLHDNGLLRVPKEGSLANLRTAHESALSRIERGNPLLRTVDKPQVFTRIFYASIERPLGRPAVSFTLRSAAGDFYPYPPGKLMHLAGMMRHAAIQAMTQYPPDGLEDAAAWVDSFVAGHRLEDINNHERFSYIPLPSIGHEHADAMIRRVMITAPFGYEEHLDHLASQLDGVQLEPEVGIKGPVLDRLSADKVQRRYLEVSSVWASVTPVILPGHDDHKPPKTIRLIQRALRLSGIDQPCGFTWSALPNFANCLTAHKYDRLKRHVGYYRPQHLEGLTAVHLRVSFESPIAGPLCIGAGRHHGFGVLASVK
jgi:CRISPR-associated protein Csb2